MQSDGHSFYARFVRPTVLAGLLSALVLFPLSTSASVFSSLTARVAEADTLPENVLPSPNSQNMALATGSNIGPSMRKGSVALVSTDIEISSDSALVPAMGPVGNPSEAAEIADVGGSITFYTVRESDTVGSIATMFNISEATIYSANPSLKKGQALKKDTILVILPFTGISYTIKSGDTIKGLAARYDADESDIRFYNNLSNTDKISIGDTIIIPNGKEKTPTPAKSTDTTTTKPPTTKPATGGSVPKTVDGLYTTTKNGTNSTPITVHPMPDYSKTDLGTALLNPLPIGSYKVSQRNHHTAGVAIDLAAPLGTPIYAVADGVVLLARSEGYNDGYGGYVIVQHVVNGKTIQSISAHASKVLVTAGQTVKRGETIALVGKTGKATGYHLHIEIRGAKNPFGSISYRGDGN